MALYTTKQGDMFDSIAYEVFGNCEYSKAIMDANPQLTDIYVFSEGEQINLPDPDVYTGSGDLPPWRRING